MDKILALPVPVRDGLLDYLANRPWREVHQAMDLLQSLPEVEPVEKPPTGDET